MLISEIKRVIDQVSRDKGISAEVLIRALEEALRSAAKKKFGGKTEVEVRYNEQAGELEVFQFKEVVETVTDPSTQISIKEGMKLDPDCELGDSLGTKMNTADFGRIAAQSAKQVIIQKMKDAEREAIYSSFIERKGEIVHGIVQRFDRNNIIVNLGQAEAVLPAREQIPGTDENKNKGDRQGYHRGDRIRAYLMDVRQESRGPQVILSRTHPNFLINLLKTEVPEINEGVVTIKSAVREPGNRAKIAVSSADSDIDAVGACVGMAGSRVKNVVQELRGEKIDIIPWHLDAAKFVCNALAPAQITRVIIDEENRSMEVIVDDHHLSQAIGKQGQNVRLASKLTKWRLDVKGETRYSKAMKAGYDSLMALPGMGISMADALYEHGFFSAEELSKASPEDLPALRDLSKADADLLIQNANQYVADKRAGEQARVLSLHDDDEVDAESSAEPMREEAEADAENSAEPMREEAEAYADAETENSAEPMREEAEADADAESSAEPMREEAEADADAETESSAEPMSEEAEADAESSAEPISEEAEADADAESSAEPMREDAEGRESVSAEESKSDLMNK